MGICKRTIDKGKESDCHRIRILDNRTRSDAAIYKHANTANSQLASAKSSNVKIASIKIANSKIKAANKSHVFARNS